MGKGRPWMRARGKERQEPPQRNGSSPGRPGPRPSGERADRPRHRPRAARPDRHLRTTGRILRPDGQPRPTAPPHPWDARAPAPASEPRPALPLQQVQGESRQLPCGPAPRMRTNGAHGEQEPASRQREAVPLPAQLPPLPPQTGQQKAPLPVRPPVRQPRARELSRCRAQAQPSPCPHGGGQTSFPARCQVRAAWPQLAPCRRTGPPERLPCPRRCRRQRSAAHLPPAGGPHHPGNSCPARASSSGRGPARGKVPALPPAFLRDAPGPSWPGHCPAAPFSPLRPPFPAATETQDRRPPAARGPWS